MIVLENLSKSYAKSKAKAVDGLSLNVPAGKIVGFLGPNGAGKTTTIKMLTGILKPDSGRVLVDGIPLQEKPLEAKARIGYVPDNPEAFARLKASEYLNFVADIYGVDRAVRKERIAEYAELFKIGGVLNARIGSYSHGMKQKLVLISSLVHDPSNWILDEPLVGLDPESAFDLKEIMRARARAGQSVFFSTHIMEVAEKLCDVISVIKEGRIVFTGSLEELRAQRGSDQSLEDLFFELIDKGEEA
jgi:ABC-2 type transport system ATP-binding protein